jgi:alpha-tubulin suppressor-like RCC1 family protein
LVKTTNQKCYAFGNGIYGQLGVGNNKNSNYPVQVKIDEVTDIAAGENFSLFLKGTTVYGSGDNSCGQISHELKKKYALEPLELKIGKATIIRAGKFSAAVIEDKFVKVWGLKSMTEPIIMN